MAIVANMNRGGSKPGERRGGRKKGSLNKATIERALMAEREVANANEIRQKLAKDHLEELVNFYARMAISTPDEVEKWSKLRMEAASRLAPYQSPKLGVVMIQPPSEQDRLAHDRRGTDSRSQQQGRCIGHRDHHQAERPAAIDVGAK